MKGKKTDHILILIYAHPELYPPTLGAIEELSKVSKRIDVVTRQMLRSNWDYPENVNIHYVNKELYQGFEIEQLGFLKKLKHFFRFVKISRDLFKTHESTWVLAYDAIALYASSFFLKKIQRLNAKLWYHNHDVTDLRNASKFSLMRRANDREHEYFEYLDLFTLPAKERLKHFPINHLKTEPIILPNFPLKSFYGLYSRNRPTPKSNLKLVFQGSIGHGHGLEEIIKILHHKIEGFNLELHLVGKIRYPYLKELQQLAENQGLANRFVYHGMKSFRELPEFLSQFDVGLAIHLPYNITYSTGGSASNKIYEYSALGLPVILFDNEHYRSYLEDKGWAFFTNVTPQSLILTLRSLIKTYQSSSEKARQDFEKYFNFEMKFSKLLESKVFNN